MGDEIFTFSENKCSFEILCSACTPACHFPFSYIGNPTVKHYITYYMHGCYKLSTNQKK